MSLDANALITLQDAKEHLTIVGAESDPVIEGLINTASALCEDFTGRALKSAERTEVYDGTAGTELTLRQYPITEVATVEFLTSGPPDAWTEQDLSAYGLYVVQPVEDTIGFRTLAFPYWRQNVRVTYTAGYVAVPSKLKEACRQIVLSIWKQRDKQAAGVSSMSVPGGQTVTYTTEDIPKQAKTLLAEYVRWDNT